MCYRSHKSVLVVPVSVICFLFSIVLYWCVFLALCRTGIEVCYVVLIVRLFVSRFSRVFMCVYVFPTCFLLCLAPENPGTYLNAGPFGNQLSWLEQVRVFVLCFVVCCCC